MPSEPKQHTKMTEKPILFSSPMVRAILEGRKTQTRRIVAWRNSTALGYTERWAWDHLVWDRPHLITKDGGLDPFGPAKLPQGYQYLHVPAWNPADGPIPKNDRDLMRYRVRPRLDAGDRLWVRECLYLDEDRGWQYADTSPLACAAHDLPQMDHWLSTRRAKQKSCPSIHMPRWASRITLLVKSVRVERVQDITEEDAIAEGMSKGPAICPRTEFSRLWDSIHGGAFGEFAWGVNPYVWVIDFEREAVPA